jgi:hypothetical protein
MSLRRLSFRILCLAGLLLAAPAQGQGVAAWPPLIGATEMFQRDEQSGLALSGFDAVTYFLPEGPQPGRPELELVWSGVAWRFASEANRTAFEADPTAFAPRMGGYDAEAISRGRIVDTSPNLYLVRDGRLYLFRNDANRARFLADQTLAAKGEAQWESVRKGLVKE